MAGSETSREALSFLDNLDAYKGLGTTSLSEISKAELERLKAEADNTPVGSIQNRHLTDALSQISSMQSPKLTDISVATLGEVTTGPVAGAIRDIALNGMPDFTTPTE